MTARTRGAAIVEAVVLLPTLVILLLGARFVACRYETEAKALRDARTCAVRFAYGGCRQIPSGCSQTGTVAAGVSSASGGMSDISGQLARAEALVQSLSSLPVLGRAMDDLLGKNAQSKQDLMFQPLQRGGKKMALVSGIVVFPCNEVPRTDDVAKDVFRSVTAPFF